MAVTLGEKRVPFDVSFDSITADHDDGHLLARRAVLHEQSLEALLEHVQRGLQVAVLSPRGVDDVAAHVARETRRDVVQFEVGPVQVDVAQELLAVLVEARDHSFDVIGVGFVSLLVAQR